jgi:hypothetical protein
LTNALINFDICAIYPSCDPLKRTPSEIPDGGKFAATFADEDPSVVHEAFQGANANTVPSKA